jgi:hypothetical protein
LISSWRNATGHPSRLPGNPDRHPELSTRGRGRRGIQSHWEPFASGVRQPAADASVPFASPGESFHRSDVIQINAVSSPRHYVVPNGFAHRLVCAFLPLT